MYIYTHMYIYIYILYLYMSWTNPMDSLFLRWSWGQRGPPRRLLHHETSHPIHCGFCFQSAWLSEVKGDGHWWTLMDTNQSLVQTAQITPHVSSCPAVKKKPPRKLTNETWQAMCWGGWRLTCCHGTGDLRDPERRFISREVDVQSPAL